MKKLIAFTLAEVIIVLGIVGIAAELTIPPLVSSAEKQTSLSKLKKFYSEFQQGLQIYTANLGCAGDLRCTELFDSSRGDKQWESRMDSEFRSVFKIVKSSPSRAEYMNKTIKNLDRSISPTASFNFGHTFVTADNFLFMIDDSKSDNCMNNINTVDSTAKLKGNCGAVYVDINNSQRPDQWGKDIFFFLLGNDGILYPNAGAEAVKVGGVDWKNNATACGTPGSNKIPAGTIGSSCSSRIIEEGWQITYY